MARANFSGNGLPGAIGTELNVQLPNLSASQELEGTVTKPWTPTLICPYVPGVGERLRSLAAHFGSLPFDNRPV